jgi:hypothetical protein
MPPHLLLLTQTRKSHCYNIRTHRDGQLLRLGSAESNMIGGKKEPFLIITGSMRTMEENSAGKLTAASTLR